MKADSHNLTGEWYFSEGFFGGLHLYVRCKTTHTNLLYWRKGNIRDLHTLNCSSGSPS